METFQPEHYIEDLYNFVYLGAPLRYIISNISFKVYQGHTIIDLLDYLPLLKHGYCHIKTIRNILMAYADITNNGYLYNIEVFNEAFGGNIPIEFYNIQSKQIKLNIENNPSVAIFEAIPIDKFQQFKEGHIELKSTKIPIQEAIDRGLIADYINTYQYEKLNDPYFDIENYDLDPDNYDVYNFFFRSFIENNIYTIYDLEQLKQYSRNNTVTIWGELSISKNIANLMVEMVDINKQLPFKFKDVIHACQEFKSTSLVDKFKNDNRLKLYYAIIIGKYEDVIKYLKEVDPRDDNSEAYRLAMESINIIVAIKDNIIEKNWYQKEAFVSGVESIVGPSNIPTELQKSIRKNFLI